MLRQLLKQILIFLTRRSLGKHRTEVVAITGDGQTSVAREAIYVVLKTKHAVRRNIEVPETEFATPLTILGTKYYPQNTIEWIQTPVKAAVQLLTVKPYKHILVLEISDVKKELAEFWLNIICPTTVVVCGETNLDPEVSRDFHFRGGHLKAPRGGTENTSKVATHRTPWRWIKIEEKGKNLKPYFKAAKEVGKQFGISKKEAKKGLKNFEMPAARIRVLRGKEGQIIIDSSYHHSPPPLKSVLELADQFEGEKLLLTDYPKDRKYRKSGIKIEKLDSKLPSPTSEVLIIRGRKKRSRKILEKLTGRFQP